MENGNADVVSKNESLVKKLASYGMSKEAKLVKELINYTNSLESNQRALLKLIIKLRRENKFNEKLIKRIYIMLTKGQKNIVDTWLEEDDDV